MQNVIEQVASGALLTREDFRRDVLGGLGQPLKTIPCKYLYDEQGAQLFEAICELQEYYPTRTETGILRRHIREIAALLGRGCHLVDLGSGSGFKTRLLLEHLERPASCTPVDVARSQLFESAERLAADWPSLQVWPVCADYTNGFILPHLPSRSERTTVFFPGSTIGNFEPEEAEGFLQRLTEICGPRVGLLLGVDLRKEPDLLHAAYNDAAGVTAAFNLNLLARVNRELEADFDLSAFRHQAVFNDKAGRIEMHLVSRRAQRVWIGAASKSVAPGAPAALPAGVKAPKRRQDARAPGGGGHEFYFAAGESIVTEHSYKYRLDEFHRLAARAGFQALRSWTDKAGWFSVNYYRADGASRGAAFRPPQLSYRRGASAFSTRYGLRGLKRRKRRAPMRPGRQR
jgi:dimethylhistidine N-methyltransferase